MLPLCATGGLPASVFVPAFTALANQPQALAPACRIPPRPAHPALWSAGACSRFVPLAACPPVFSSRPAATGKVFVPEKFCPPSAGEIGSPTSRSRRQRRCYTQLTYFEDERLRIAHGLGSVTLCAAAAADSLVLRIAHGLGSVTLNVLPRVQRDKLRIAHGLGSVTLDEQRHTGRAQLRIAHGLGSVTLVGDKSHIHLLLRIAHGLGSVTLVERAHRYSFQLRIAHGLGSVTLLALCTEPLHSCGLLTGWDRLHYLPRKPRPERGLLLPGL